MKKAYLIIFYDAVFGCVNTQFLYNQRNTIQSLIYLMQEAGISLPESYNFHWFENYGPYSIKLKNELIKFSNERNQKEAFIYNRSAIFNRFISNIREILNKVSEDERPLLLIYIACLHYIKNIVLSQNATDEEIVNKLYDISKRYTDKRFVKIALEGINKGLV